MFVCVSVDVDVCVCLCVLVWVCDHGANVHECVYRCLCDWYMCCVFICACSSECKWVTIFFPWWLWTQLGECDLLRQDKGG